MSEDSDLVLLDRFAATGDELSFAALVERHAGMVLGVAWRRTQEWTSAEEIAQNVFAILARKARSLLHANLAGWLYQTALLEARNSFRKAARYRAALDQFSRETMNTQYSMDLSWQHLYPHLDEAISQLNTPSVLKKTAIAIVIAAIPITILWQQNAAGKAAARRLADQEGRHPELERTRSEIARR